MFVLPLGRQRALGIYRSATTGMLILAWQGGHADDVRRWLETFKHADDLIASYQHR
jgi:hypothetical protein